MKDEIIRKTSGMKAFTLEELDSSHSYFGIVDRKQVDKKILQSGKGLWASIAFKFQQLVPHTDEWTDRVMLASFKKMNGYFTRYSYFNIRNKEEAQHVCDLLKEWWNL